MKIKRYAIGLISLTLIVLTSACYLFFSKHQSRYSPKGEPIHEEKTIVQEQTITGEESEY